MLRLRFSRLKKRKSPYTSIDTVIAQFEQYIKLNKNVPIEIINVTNSVESPGRLADIIVAHLKLKVEVKQNVLSAFSAEERLSMICDILNREIEILNIEKKIRGRVRKQMEQVQKEYYLREQIKAIQKELGENDEVAQEVKEFKKAIDKAKMPKEVLEKVEKELDKFQNVIFVCGKWCDTELFGNHDGITLV